MTTTDGQDRAAEAIAADAARFADGLRELAAMIERGQFPAPVSLDRDFVHNPKTVDEFRRIADAAAWWRPGQYGGRPALIAEMPGRCRAIVTAPRAERPTDPEALAILRAKGTRPAPVEPDGAA